MTLLTHVPQYPRNCDKVTVPCFLNKCDEYDDDDDENDDVEVNG